MTVVADTSSLHYAVLINEVGTLQALYGSIVIPEAVFRELQSPRAPKLVRRWVANLPEWVQVQAALVDIRFRSGAPGSRRK